MDKKILIAYFSYSGNAKSIAEKIQAKTGGDIFRIETVTPYPANYNETAYGIAKEQHDNGIKPELKDNGDISNYNVIFVGTPAWWYEMTPAVKTFLSSHDFKNKTIIPFITHGGGGKYSIAQDMEKMTGAKVLNPLVLYDNGGNNAQVEIDKWLDELNY